MCTRQSVDRFQHIFPSVLVGGMKIDIFLRYRVFYFSAPYVFRVSARCANRVEKKTLPIANRTKGSSLSITQFVTLARRRTIDKHFLLTSRHIA